MSHWGVVGGGLLGMTLALRLRQGGARVTLLEAGDGVGGLAAAWSLGDLVWDRHYHVTLLSDSHLRGLLEELELAEELRWADAQTGFYTDGGFHSMSSAFEFLRFPPLNLVQKARLAATILYASRLRNWRALEAQPVADWLRKWSGPATCEKIWVPLLRAKLGDSYRRTSAAFIWATIARMYAARRGGHKQEKFGYVRGGYARILARFSQHLRQAGVAIELGAPARRVEPGGRGGLEVSWGDGRRTTFDQVAVTVPAGLAAEICVGLSEDEVERLRGIEYLGIVCPSVVLSRPLSPYYITNITDEVPFSAVIEMTSLVDPETFGGRSLVYLPKYAPPDAAIFGESDGGIRERFLKALAAMHPDLTDGHVLDFRVSRARHVFALPTLGYSERLPPIHTSVAGLHIVNSAHIVNGTLNVNETVQLAERNVPALLGAGGSHGG